MIRLAACILAVAVVSGPLRAEAPPPSITAVKTEIREAFDRFRRAVLRGDRRSVAAMVTGDAERYGAALLQMARTWDRARLGRQSAVTQIAVLGLRLDTDPGELVAMTPAEAFARTYEAGVVDPLVFEEMQLVEIDLGPGRQTATALVGIDARRSDAPIAFALRDGSWRVDPVGISNQISFSLTVLLQSRGVTEEVYVADFMEQMYGETFTEQAWQPTAARSARDPD